MTATHWPSAIQLETNQQASSRGCKHPLRTGMLAGYPWLPEPKQHVVTTAAMSEATQAAALSPNAMATGHASSPPLASLASIPTEASTEAASHQVTTSASQRSAVAPGAVMGSGRATADGPGCHTPHTPPPSAGRGSESGVSTSEPSSRGAGDRLFPAPPNTSRSSRKNSGATLPQPNVQVAPLIILPMAEVVFRIEC